MRIAVKARAARALMLLCALCACSQADDVAVLQALTDQPQTISCAADNECPRDYFCHDAACRRPLDLTAGQSCEVGPDCRSGLVCLRRSPGSGGTCESVVHQCGKPPGADSPCADVLACAPGLCQAFVGDVGFTRVVCGTSGGRSPAQANVLVECAVGAP